MLIEVTEAEAKLLATARVYADYLREGQDLRSLRIAAEGLIAAARAVRDPDAVREPERC